MKEFSVNDLFSNLKHAGIEDSVSYSMLVIQDRYMFNLGIQRQLNFPLEDYAAFDDGLRESKDGFGSVTYDPFLLEKIFVEKCNVSEREAALFTETETKYLVELGLM